MPIVPSESSSQHVPRPQQHLHQQHPPNSKHEPEIAKASRLSAWWTIPDSVRNTFDRFPIRTYTENWLPQRAPRKQKQNVLYVFSISHDTSSKNLSCNPVCLRWQTYLQLNNIPFSIATSNNHASPSGALPFLIPAQSKKEPISSPIPANKLARWAESYGANEDAMNVKQEIYSALLDQNIRNAWLYHLYLDTDNFDAVAKPLYIYSASNNRFIQFSLAYQLKDAAQKELLKSGRIIDSEEIYASAEKAFCSISALLGSAEFFSARGRPGLFDASVFAYTHLILEPSLDWKNLRLQRILSRYPHLLDHRNRVLHMYMES